MAKILTGWELDDSVGDLLLTGEHGQIADFVAAYGPLAAFNRESSVVAVIRRYHPTLNCQSDHELYTSDDHSIRIALNTITSSMFFHLPKSLTFERLSLVPQFVSAGLPVDFSISTREFGTIVTNAFELGSRLAPQMIPLPEAEMLAAFQTLRNVRPKPRIPVTSTRIHLPSIGELKQSDFNDWWTVMVPVPMLGQSLPLTVMNFNPDDPDQKERTELIDQAVRAFLSAGPEALTAAGPRVLSNCQEYIDAVGLEDWNRDMADVNDPAGIWKFVRPHDVYVQYEPHSRRVYVSISCNCDWEEEHGLQLVYRDGAVLTRVSAEDGHPVD